MKHYLPKNTEDGAALIITLLIVVLLATISVSFFSTTRTEQTATRNYTSKTQAEQFATMATQQAMATLQSAFNDTGSMSGNYTGVVTSQPGAIKKFFFQNGNCTKNAATNLFFAANSTNANGTVNMNNLANSTNSSIAGLITGNVSENISVYLVDVKDNSGNQTIGRIAYYVDDEGTKINLNSATSNRSGLNIANSRGLSLSALSNNTTTLNALDFIFA
jgi:Tfp pilus assembly protein PilX